MFARSQRRQTAKCHSAVPARKSNKESNVFSASDHAEVHHTASCTLTACQNAFDNYWLGVASIGKPHNLIDITYSIQRARGTLNSTSIQCKHNNK
jgi:hypothetical protein